MNKKVAVGHLFAVLTVFVWGTTFISTKLLLADFSPVEILLFRFVLGFVVLLVLYPKRLRITDKKQELLFAAAGLCGITLYFLLENIALTYTSATNVGVFVSVAPFFTAILARIFLKEERPGPLFYLGFCCAIGGIFLISFTSTTQLGLSPKGDILAVLSAVVWAVYSILTRKIAAFGHHTIQATRRTFFYGILFMIPALFAFDFRLGLERLALPRNLYNILFLGIGASALCFVSWNLALSWLGAVKTSVYIYLVPVVTAAVSVLVLHESLTRITVLGILLTLTGLSLSEIRRLPFRKKVSSDQR